MKSIEWLSNEVYQAIDLHSQGKLSPTYCLVKIAEAKDKAKEMHKQEIINAWYNGYISPMVDEENCGEQFYKETFKKD